MDVVEEAGGVSKLTREVTCDKSRHWDESITQARSQGMVVVTDEKAHVGHKTANAHLSSCG